MDAVTLAMAKKYTDSQRLGYADYETFDQVSFDGNIADNTTIPGEALGLSGTFVHASDSVFDGGVAHKANVYTQNHWNYNVKNLRVDKSDDGIWFLFGELVASGVIYEGERLLAMSFGAALADALGCPAGTYVWTDTIEGIYLYVGVFEGNFTETIHPIDPKFLTKVIDLTKYTAEFAGTTHRLNDIILELFAKGGGYTELAEIGEFWNDVNTTRPLQFLIDLSISFNDVRILAECNSRTMFLDTVGGVVCSFLVILDTASRVTLVFALQDNGNTRITVAVEPVTISGA